MPDANYMDRQDDINSKMRAILVDWLVDVHYKYGMCAQTLHMTVALIDRFLSKEYTIPRQRLQLVGITSMFIASKYEEIYPPEVFEFVRITDHAYRTEDVFAMEEDMLRALQYYVTAPTAYQFLTRFFQASGSTSQKTMCFALYVIDRALQEFRLIKYPPSVIAAAAIYIARAQMIERPTWVSMSVLLLARNTRRSILTKRSIRHDRSATTTNSIQHSNTIRHILKRAWRHAFEKSKKSFGASKMESSRANLRQ